MKRRGGRGGPEPRRSGVPFSTASDPAAAAAADANTNTNICLAGAACPLLTCEGAPLIVVPRDELDKSRVEHHARISVEDSRATLSDEITGDGLGGSGTAG